MKREKMIEIPLDLRTPAGVTEAGATLAEIVCRSILFDVVKNTAPALRGDLFERFISGLSGAALAELGPDRTKQALDAAKLAVDDCIAEHRRNAH